MITEMEHSFHDILLDLLNFTVLRTFLHHGFDLFLSHPGVGSWMDPQEADDVIAEPCQQPGKRPEYIGNCDHRADQGF